MDEFDDFDEEEFYDESLDDLINDEFEEDDEALDSSYYDLAPFDDPEDIEDY